jgi:hypothetical protein
MTPSQKKHVKSRKKPLLNSHKTHKKFSKNPQKTVNKLSKNTTKIYKKLKNPHKNPQENQKVISFCKNIKINVDLAMRKGSLKGSARNLA